MTDTTVSNYLLERLKQLGLTHLFAVPGDYASPFLKALDSFEGIERVATIAELGAGYAADGYARFKGIGAACVQYGVGTFSLLNCAAGAFVERLPVVIISASPTTANRREERQKGVLFHHSTGDLRSDQKVFQNVTVASEIIRSGADAPQQIDRALTALLTHQRPIYLEVLSDVLTHNCAAPQGQLVPETRTSDPSALQAALDAAWARISTAQNPVLWGGIELLRFGLEGVFQELIDASGLPFTTTSLAKTILDESQPAFVGTYAGPASLEQTRTLMESTDCPIALGTIITDDYLDIMASDFGPMIEATEQEMRVGYAYFPQVTLRDFLQGLRARFQASPNFPRSAAPPMPTPIAESVAPREPLSYTRFYEALSAYLDENERKKESVLILGESTSLYVFGNLMGLPQRGFVANAAWGSLGHETGCALGVALASGKRPLVVAGDGGFRMVCQELSSLVQSQCPAVIFVMSNQVYAIEQAFVDINAFTPQGQFAGFDILPSWDYTALAQGFGARGFRAETLGELQQVLAELDMLTDIPALVEIVIPEKDLAPQLRRLATTP